MNRTILAILSILISISSYAQYGQSLLFHLSGDNGATADFAKGDPNPNFLSGVSIVEDGAKGRGFRCSSRQLMAYKAPGNIYADRGTLAFYWRADEPFTKTEFPIFRVGYADHTSWDMVWLRIDYNGKGIEAFVTDNNLARIRVKKDLSPLPEPDRWTHIAVSWDENRGIRLYLNGRLAAKKDTVMVLNTGLDQFGPHSRVISPYQVQSSYNMQRGGGIDEIRIYDRMLSDSQIAMLASGKTAEESEYESPEGSLDAWKTFMGFDGQMPPYLKNENTAARKIGINETYDIKRWYWKSNDGIRETTWPGVYNLSRIQGRTDYFQLPDWDCYSTSGWQVRFNMPDEDWNYIQVTGGAYGVIGVTENRDGSSSTAIGSKARGTQRSFLMLDKGLRGNTVTFTNDVQETPIQEFDVFNVTEGTAPEGTASLTYYIGAWDNFDNPGLIEVEEYVAGRFHEDGRSMLLARPSRGSSNGKKQNRAGLPLAHIVIPCDFRDIEMHRTLKIEERGADTEELASWSTSARNNSWAGMHAGLDGILVEIPALDVKPLSDNGLYPLNIQVKDPVWKLRNMADFSFSVKPGEARSIWLDLRDRILPEDKPLYMTVSGASADFSAALLEGMRIRLVFKPWEEASKEHIEDRLTQVKDNYAMICEENTSSRRLAKYRQIEADMLDLLKVDPGNALGRKYWYIYHPEQIEPEYKEPQAPAGVPEWAFVQMEVLKQYREIIEWFIDNRQIENGEFGGGISDDTDLTNWFPALIQMGSIPKKAGSSLARFIEAIYEQKTLTDGMSTIQTDGLHTYEEGVNTVCQANVAGWGDPIYAERLMESARTIRDRLLGINAAGHIHFRSDYFSATKIAEEGPWAWSSYREFYHTGPALLLGEFYGNKGARKNMTDFAESLLAHAKTDSRGKLVLPSEINFITDEVRAWESRFAVPMMWYSWLWTGNERYLQAVLDSQWKQPLPDQEKSVADLRKVLKNMDRRREIITEGSVWIDRLSLDYSLLQTVRMGGICMDRSEHFAPFNLVSWRFPDEYDAEKAGILFMKNERDDFSIKFFNASGSDMTVTMRGEEIPAGTWAIEKDGHISEVLFGRGRAIELTVPAGREYIVSMKLRTMTDDFNSLTDLAISERDVKTEGRTITVTVHNISGTDAPECNITVTDRRGRTIAQTKTPAIPAPNDLVPKTAEVSIVVPAGSKPYKITVNPEGIDSEIYGTNNTLIL